jgi:hypothetical protein
MTDFLLWVPNSEDTGSWHPMLNLPLQVIKEMQATYDLDYQSTPGKLAINKTAIRHPEQLLDIGSCISMRVISRKLGQSQCRQANDNFMRTCDNCINKRRLCARAVKVDE